MKRKHTKKPKTKHTFKLNASFMKHVHIVSYFRKKLCMVVNGLRQIIF